MRIFLFNTRLVHRSLLIAISSLLLNFSPDVLGKVNASLVKEQQISQLKTYYHSGQYFEEIRLKLNQVQEYLSQLATQARTNRLAIILDIDETALSNFQDLERLQFTHDPAALMGAYMLGGATAVPAVSELYQYAIANNFKVFFISERPNTPEIISATARNLRNAGFSQWEELILKPIEHSQSNQAFKTMARRHIALQGYDVILNIGDQEEDLKGGFAEVKIKLPNPFKPSYS